MSTTSAYRSARRILAFLVTAWGMVSVLAFFFSAGVITGMVAYRINELNHGVRCVMVAKPPRN